VDAEQSYPVRIEGELDPGVSRWLWLVKWLLAIPHYIVLAFLWLTFLVLTVVAFFGILITGRYPRGVFDFNLGVLRWTWRVGFYSYAALGTDRYPPFRLGDVPDYPARLEVAYPERLSRGLVLVKWWLLAIPHYVVVGILLGGGSYAASRAYDRAWGFGFETGLIGVLVFFAGVALLFTTRYPRGIFDFVIGMDRWVARVAAYVFLMRDEYPPFRLDQGGTEPAPGAPGSEPPGPSLAVEPAPEVERGGGGVGRTVLLVLGSIAAILSFALLAGGCALVVIDQTQRDDDGYLMSPSRDFSTPTYAIVSERADLDVEGTKWAVDRFLGTVRIRSKSQRAVFVGIAPAADAERYLLGTERDVVTGLDNDHPSYSHRPGGVPASPPSEQTFWVASATGSGEQTVDWKPHAGDWRAVVMNRDAARGVASDMSIGAELDSVVWIGAALLGIGALLAAGAAISITAGVRRR
jgi:hypothetical protein